MPAEGRVNAIPNPIVGRRTPGRIFEHLLIMHDRRMILLAQFDDDCLTHRKVSTIFLPIGLLSTHRQAEWFAEHQLYFRQRFNCVTEQLVILLLELFRGNSGAQIIDADENAEDIGPEVIDVFLPA
jgi:hypothetical protein